MKKDATFAERIRARHKAFEERHGRKPWSEQQGGSMNQLSLDWNGLSTDFKAPDWRKRVRRTDPDTSMIAAKVAPVSKHGKMVLEGLKQGSGTSYEIGRRVGLDHVQVSRRMPELEAQGLVRVVGRELGDAGTYCRCWALK